MKAIREIHRRTVDEAASTAQGEPRRNLVLHWPHGFVLQTATNVMGPYEDMRPTATPAVGELTEPCRFFRLREQPE